MTIGQHQDQAPLAPDDLAGQLADMAATSGVTAPALRWVAGRSGRYDERCQTITLGRDLLATPGYARATLAHEFGHHLDSRSHPQPAHIRVQRSVLVLAQVVTMAICIVLIGAATSPGKFIDVPWYVILLLWVGMIAGATGVLMSARFMGLLQTAGETTADLIGADLGFPFTADIMGPEDLAETRRARIWAWIDGAHPTWPRRIAAIADHTAGAGVDRTLRRGGSPARPGTVTR